MMQYDRIRATMEREALAKYRDGEITAEEYDELLIDIECEYERACDWRDGE